MKLERIQTIQRLPIQIEEAWDFFTSPKNMRLISPHWLDYRLTMEPPEYLHPGTIVSASIRPIPIYSTNWISEITHVRPLQFYISEQRVGPFKMWHHEHYFRAHDEGVELEDIIMYGMPFGKVGSLVHNMFIRKKLHEAFSFRAQALEQRFGTISKPKPQKQRRPEIPKIFQKQPEKPKTAEKSPLQQEQRQQPSLQPPAQDTPRKRPENASQNQLETGQNPAATPGKPVPQKVTLDDIFRGSDD